MLLCIETHFWWKFSEYTQFLFKNFPRQSWTKYLEQTQIFMKYHFLPPFPPFTMLKEMKMAVEACAPCTEVQYSKQHCKWGGGGCSNILCPGLFIRGVQGANHPWKWQLHPRNSFLGCILHPWLFVQPVSSNKVLPTPFLAVYAFHFITKKFEQILADV